MGRRLAICDGIERRRILLGLPATLILSSGVSAQPLPVAVRRYQRMQTQRDLAIRANFWTMAIPALALFWAAVGYGIHSL